MAGTLVGGAFLCASVQTMMEKLSSTEFRDYINNNKLNVSLLKQLETTLLTLQAVLDDAEQKQINNPAVKQWLDELKDAIFDAEDLLNEISYDSLRCKVETNQAANKSNQVWNFLSYTFKSFNREINSRMKIMCERLQLFAQHKDILGLQSKVGRVSLRTPSSSVVNESVIVGREEDKGRLMNMLLSDSDMSNNYTRVVAILGMGGVGKTTLAQFVYNDKKVQQHFDLKAWACVSEDFDILRVTKTLLESVTSRVWESNNLDFLRVELKQNLRDKRFLFVLDDLWNDNYNDWDELLTPLISGKTGSKVLITTRQLKVAEVAHTFPILKLEPLSHENCWSLLSKHAFRGEEFIGVKFPNLEVIGRKIARKCGGLPIAAKTLGGLLHSKVDTKAWTAILDSEIWNLPNDNIVPALLLSYQYLPSHLKRCFAYCSIFPKDYPLDKKQLVLLWMAEGFLEFSHGQKATEEVGDDYFVELLSRSLIQQRNDDFGGQTFFMHDLVNDLATIVSGKSCCRLEYGGNISNTVRHLSYNRDEYNIFKKFEVLYDFTCLRSFLPIGHQRGMHYLSRQVVDDLLPTLRRLRVLSLSNFSNITMLPDSIGRLVQLRYLDLSSTEIESLPDTICNLYNLQTLILSSCRNLTEFPIDIGKLVCLRHLDISETSIKELPIQIVGLESLQTLTFFVVGKTGVGLSIQELKIFPHLQGKFSILNLDNVINAMEAHDADLKSKEQIEELILKWGRQTEDSLIEKAVLGMLQPSINLQKLSIILYAGTSFPSWLGDSSFSNMVSLCISKCEYCTILPSLGQLLSLKELRINELLMLETIGPEFYSDEEILGTNYLFQPFPSLVLLEFRNMANWEEWLPFEGCKFPFPRLKTLRLDKCPKIRGHLPSHLTSIEQLEINGCDCLLAKPPTLHWLSSIESININESERTQWSLLGSDSPCLLQRASICWCDKLLSLPKMIIRSTCLQHLKLYQIMSLTAFPVDGLPTSLQTLLIDQCPNLSFLPPKMWGNYTSLVGLELWNSCDALTSFALDGFPVLQRLMIGGCRSLESIFISESCSPFSHSTLQLLWVINCKALRSLPKQVDTLTSLEHLTLEDLPQMELSFFGACLPPKLQNIRIRSLRITKPVTEWGLQRLTALSHFHIICGDDIVKTMLKKQLLPISLVYLSISCPSEMKSFGGNGLRHLSSLETLVFRNCPMLESLSADMLPSSLRTLEFHNCPRLESLPEDKLPSSLKLLSIELCLVLEEKYGSERGENWSNIAHIPVIKINGKVTI